MKLINNIMKEYEVLLEEMLIKELLLFFSFCLYYIKMIDFFFFLYSLICKIL